MYNRLPIGTRGGKKKLNMRCKQCGWENPAENEKCEKCGTILDVYESSENLSESIKVRFNPKGTVSETDAFQKQDERERKPVSNSCEKCGYPLSADSKTCPQCGAVRKECETKVLKCSKCGEEVDKSANFCPKCGEKLSNEKPMEAPMGTINNWKNPEKGVFCTLKAIEWDNENVKYEPVTFSGDKINLNRANLDPNNNTITSKTQAVLLHEGDSWYFENVSKQKTTFIQVNKKIKLEDGDILLMGNRMFEFKE